MLHMRQFVRHDAAQLTLTQQANDTGGGRDGGILGIAPRGKCVGLRFVNQINSRHRQLRPRRKIAHHIVEIRRRRLIDGLRAVHVQHHLV